MGWVDGMEWGQVPVTVSAQDHCLTNPTNHLRYVCLGRMATGWVGMCSPPLSSTKESKTKIELMQLSSLLSEQLSGATGKLAGTRFPLTPIRVECLTCSGAWFAPCGWGQTQHWQHIIDPLFPVISCLSQACWLGQGGKAGESEKEEGEGMASSESSHWFEIWNLLLIKAKLRRKEVVWHSTPFENTMCVCLAQYTT